MFYINIMQLVDFEFVDFVFIKQNVLIDSLKKKRLLL